VPFKRILFVSLAYLLLGRWLTPIRSPWKHALFALMNVLAVYLVYAWDNDNELGLGPNSFLFVVYLAVVSAQYIAMRVWGRRAGWLPWLAFLIPIGVLVLIRYVPVRILAGVFGPAAFQFVQRHPEFALGSVFVGFSYLAFRTSSLVLEVRNGVVPPPSVGEYFGFAFFLPTMSLGPISPYSQYRRSFEEAPSAIPIGDALLRILLGAVKFRFLGPLLNQLTYSGLLQDGHPHLWVDLPIAAIAYYLYLYCNFSGFCDIAIGAAGFMHISVAENFNNPFVARNLQDFWNRWHITLSHYMRDIVFSPLSKALVRIMGPARANHAIAISIFVVFLLVGIWHGTGWNYAAFGAIHGVGLTVNHYYTFYLKKWLGKVRFAAYERNPYIRAAAVSLTFMYVAGALFVFANDFTSMRGILASLRSS